MLAVYGDERDEIPASALAVAFEFVAAELRLVDAADYIAYIHQEKFANIHDIVSSSVELFSTGNACIRLGRRVRARLEQHTGH